MGIKALEDDYVDGIDNCKSFLNERIMLKKGEFSPTIDVLHGKLTVL